MSQSIAAWVLKVLDDEDGPRRGGAPPGSPPTQKFEGPWFSTQLVLSLSIGVTSFFVFCILRTRWDLVYMGRTKLKDFSPTPAHSPDAYGSSKFFGWIIPTLRTSEFTVLQTVGLDAAVLLNFYRMAFLLFTLLAFLAAVVLMPLNLFRNGSTDSDAPGDLPRNDTFWSQFVENGTLATAPPNRTVPDTSPSMYDILLSPQTSATINLLFTYLFTALMLLFLHRNFHRFVQSRQAFSLPLLHSISTRTVLVTNVPSHLRGDRALADYFEGCGWQVESVSVCRGIEPLRRVLERRTNALLRLEAAWAEWVGNPAKGVRGYDPNVYAEKNKIARSLTASPKRASEPLIAGIEGESSTSTTTPTRTSNREQSTDSLSPPDSDTNGLEADTEAGEQSYAHVHMTKPRPVFRPRWFGSKVDAIQFWERKFRKADEEVRDMRKTGRFDATHVAFVTFEDVKDAQMACQVTHYPQHSEVVTEPAPEPRDVVWSNVSMSQRKVHIRQFVVLGLMVLLLLTWIVPVGSLATLLSYREIQKVMPWLAKLIDRSPRLAAIVQNSLPSLVIITFNSLLPFLLSWFSYQQGIRSRSATEYSLLRKYHLFLLVSVLFIFLLTSTFWALVRDLADSPGRIPEKLAVALLQGTAKNFMISYVMLQSLGLMPLQLLNLGPLFTLGWARATSTSTPRSYAEANAPPMLNYGWVYPQALLVFTITLVFSVVSPLILVFGALYFGAAYLVFKYKLLFIYFKPYESNGEAWRITFARLLWALLFFQVFMTGLFSLRKPFWLFFAMFPLILFTLWWAWTTHRDFDPLSKYLALSSICDVQRGEGAESAAGVRDEDQVPRSQSNLNHRRYAVNDETLYVAPSDKRTDYSQPPMSSFYYGVLNTGRRRYAHPALSGPLPFPWLPAKAKPRAFGDGALQRRGVVLSLRRKMAKKLRRHQSDPGDDTEGEIGSASASGTNVPEGWNMDDSLGVPSGPDQGTSGGTGQEGELSSSQLSTASNPWRESTPTPADRMKKRFSFDPASGVIALPEDNVWGDEGSESDNEGETTPNGGPPASPSTYFHHPERRRTISGTESALSGNKAPVGTEALAE